MTLLGVISAVTIGIIIGLFGSGGAILTVPSLVYLFHIPAVKASYFSLFIVGVSSAISVVPLIFQKVVEVKKGLLLFLPSLAGVLISRRLFLPYIPEELHVLGLSLTKNNLLLICFASVMIYAARSMLKKSAPRPGLKLNDQSSERTGSIIVLGFCVGIISGFIGVGGGVLLLPVLVNYLKIEMRRAAATSMFIVSINSSAGFIFDPHPMSVSDWMFVLPFMGVTLLASFIGIRMGKKLPEKKLKNFFGFFILLSALSILIKELIF